jgi:hypothetical protein
MYVGTWERRTLKVLSSYDISITLFLLPASLYKVKHLKENMSHNFFPELLVWVLLSIVRLGRCRTQARASRDGHSSEAPNSRSHGSRITVLCTVSMFTFLSRLIDLIMIIKSPLRESSHDCATMQVNRPSRPELACCVCQHRPTHCSGHALQMPTVPVFLVKETSASDKTSRPPFHYFVSVSLLTSFIHLFPSLFFI